MSSKEKTRILRFASNPKIRVGLIVREILEIPFPLNMIAHKEAKALAERHLSKGQDSNGSPKGKPTHANKAHIVNYGPQSYFPEMFPGIWLRSLFHMVSLLLQPSI